MGMVMIDNFDEFVMTEFDIHISNSSSDTMLYNELKTLAQAAIQNGQATISDLISISQTDSIQGIARKLKDSAKRIQEEQMQQQQQAQQANKLSKLKCRCKKCKIKMLKLNVNMR
jgi:hypothetical protein